MVNSIGIFIGAKGELPTKPMVDYGFGRPGRKHGGSIANDHEEPAGPHHFDKTPDSQNRKLGLGCQAKGLLWYGQRYEPVGGIALSPLRYALPITSDHFSYCLGALRIECDTPPVRFLADFLHQQAISVGPAWQHAAEEVALPT